MSGAVVATGGHESWEALGERMRERPGTPVPRWAGSRLMPGRRRSGDPARKAATASDLPTQARDSAEPVVSLGARLKAVRLKSGLSLREVARRLGVSPSFVSQLENGKSQPSVATLYSFSQLLDVSIDELFSGEGGTEADAPASTPSSAPGEAGVQPSTRRRREASGEGRISRSELGSPANAWPADRSRARLSVTRPGSRVRLEMDSGVVWEQLATNTGTDVDFIEIIYPAHSSSTTDQRMLQHTGSEYGYLLEGELEITVGFDVVTLRAGEAIGFDSAVPHLLTNRGDVPARGIWFVRHPQD